MADFAKDSEGLCVEHGFSNCSLSHKEDGIPKDDGFLQWVESNRSGIEGEDDVEELMHAAWSAAIKHDPRSVRTAKEWRNNAFEASASIADRYGSAYAAADIRALKS